MGLCTKGHFFNVVGSKLFSVVSSLYSVFIFFFNKQIICPPLASKAGHLPNPCLMYVSINHCSKPNSYLAFLQLSHSAVA